MSDAGRISLELDGGARCPSLINVRWGVDVLPASPCDDSTQEMICAIGDGMWIKDHAQTTSRTTNDLAVIHATGKMAERIRHYELEQAPLGPVESWPDVLIWSTNLMLDSGFPTSNLWGREFIQLYNDAYLPLTPEKHPSLLGRPAATQWQEAWHILVL